MWWPLSYGFLWLLTRNEACQFQPHIIWVKPHLHPYADSNCWCRNVQPAGAWYAGDGWEFWAAPAALKVVTESLLVPMIRAIVDEQINQTKEENNLNIFQNILVIYRHIVVNRQPVFGLPIFFSPLGLFLVILNTPRWIQRQIYLRMLVVPKNDPRDFKKLQVAERLLSGIMKFKSNHLQESADFKNLSRVTGIILRITLKWHVFPTNFAKADIHTWKCMHAGCFGWFSFFLPVGCVIFWVLKTDFSRGKDCNAAEVCCQQPQATFSIWTIVCCGTCALKKTTMSPCCSTLTEVPSTCEKSWNILSLSQWLAPTLKFWGLLHIFSRIKTAPVSLSKMAEQYWNSVYFPVCLCRRIIRHDVKMSLKYWEMSRKSGLSSSQSRCRCRWHKAKGFVGNHRLLPVCQALGEPMIQAWKLEIQTCLGVDGGFVVLIGTTCNSYVDESVDGSPLHLLMIDVQLFVFPLILVLILLISVLFVLVLVWCWLFSLFLGACCCFPGTVGVRRGPRGREGG